MNSAKTIHKDHIEAIMDLDYSPTGREFVTGSFDRTIRIFDYNQGRSKEVYHAKRMQIINSVLYTADSHYILSGTPTIIYRFWRYEHQIMEGRKRKAIRLHKPKIAARDIIPKETDRQIWREQKNKKDNNA